MAAEHNRPDRTCAIEAIAGRNRDRVCAAIDRQALGGRDAVAGESATDARAVVGSRCDVPAGDPNPPDRRIAVLGIPGPNAGAARTGGADSTAGDADAADLRSALLADRGADLCTLRLARRVDDAAEDADAPDARVALLGVPGPNAGAGNDRATGDADVANLRAAPEPSARADARRVGPAGPVDEASLNADALVCDDTG
jgi:hypothetical protein